MADELLTASEAYIQTCEDIGELVSIARDGGALEQALRATGKWRGDPRYYEVARAFLWAEWRAGHQLRAAERSKGTAGPGRGHIGEKTSSHNDTGFSNLLDQHALNRNTAYRWITMSFAPREAVEKYMTKRQDDGAPFKRSEVLKIGKAHRPLDAPLIGDGYEIIHADLIDTNIADESIECIITDPPYPREFIGEYAKLSQFAARVLKPGGSCLAMAGQTYLPDVMTALAQHLNYHWCVSYLTPGGQAVQQWDRQVNTFWKPVLWFVKGEFQGEWIGDVVKSDVNDNDKRFHHWGQSESGMARIVERFSRPDELICDPFVGGGTTAVAALARGRRFVGIDKSKEAVTETLARLSAFNEAVENAGDVVDIR